MADRDESREETIARLRAEVAEAKRLLDPAVVEAARYLVRNADTHPHTCCVKCAAAITEAEAEVARLTREKDSLLQQRHNWQTLEAQTYMPIAEEARALRAALQALADAADARLHDPNWIPLLNARRVLAAGEKPET